MHIYLIILIIVINYIVILYNTLQIFLYMFKITKLLFQHINIILIYIFKKNYFLS